VSCYLTHLRIFNKNENDYENILQTISLGDLELLGTEQFSSLKQYPKTKLLLEKPHTCDQLQVQFVIVKELAIVRNAIVKKNGNNCGNRYRRQCHKSEN